MSHVETRKGQPIYWFDGKTPKRTITGPDGLTRDLKMTAKPWRPFINGAGSVYQLGLTCAAADRNIHGANAVQVIRRKLSKGHVPADECPVVTGRMPSGLRHDDDKKCDGYENENGFPIQQPNKPPCIHAQRIIDARTKAHNAKSDEWNKAFAGTGNKMLELMMKREEREAKQFEAANAPPAEAKKK